MSIRLVPQSDLCYFYDGSLDGLLCCVFAAFRDRALPGRMALLCGAQLSFAERAQQIPTDPAVAERVQQGILSRIGPEALARVQLAARCPAADAPRTVLRYLALGFETGPRVDQRLTEPVVARMDAMLRLLNREAMHWQQFLRFAQLANGVFHADFAPEHDLLTLLIPYFADRFGAQPFLLHDSGRRVAAAWDGVRWRVGSTSGVRMPANHADEAAWQALWRTFYDAVAIRQRLNPKLRRNFMPKKFWGNLPELRPKFITKGEAAERCERGFLSMPLAQTKKAEQSPAFSDKPTPSPYSSVTHKPCKLQYSYTVTGSSLT